MDKKYKVLGNLNLSELEAALNQDNSYSVLDSEISSKGYTMAILQKTDKVPNTTKKYKILGNMDLKKFEEELNGVEGYHVVDAEISPGGYALAIMQEGEGGGGGGDTGDYIILVNKPQINGVTLVGDKSAEDLGLGKSTEKEKEDFVTKYGPINLLDNPINDWEQFMTDTYRQLGVNRGVGLYNTTELVEIWVDKENPYPIMWQWGGHWYGKNADGITEISPQNAIIREELSEAVLNLLDHDILDGGNY